MRKVYVELEFVALFSVWGNIVCYWRGGDFSEPQMLLAVNTNFVAFSHYLNDISGQIFVFFILTVAAAEAAIGLAILIVLFRNLRTINVDDLGSLKG